MTTHYHHGHGLTGYGPGESETCLSITCLAECVRESLSHIVDGWRDQAHGERFHVEQLRGMRPSNGSDPTGYEGSWESIATAAMRALECLDRADEADTLAMNLRPERQSAPLYRQDLAAWVAELRRLLLGCDTYPLNTTLNGYHRFYVYGCIEWRCLLNEHDSGYAVPSAATAGGYQHCACRDCMEILVWSPESGEAPYCADCVEADCAHRDRGECDATPDDTDGGGE